MSQRYCFQNNYALTENRKFLYKTPQLWVNPLKFRPTENIIIKLHRKLTIRPTLHCWLFRECELNWLDEHSRSRHHRHGTHCLLTLDNATLYQLLNAILKPTYLLTLDWRHKRLCIRIGHYGAIQMLYYYYYYYYEMYRRCELMTLTFDLGGHGACG